MNAVKSIALIQCGIKGYPVQELPSRGEKAISKVFVLNNGDSKSIRTHYPHAEFVDNKEFILQDTSIDHVIICDPASADMHLVAEVLKAGKKVQILTN